MDQYDSGADAAYYPVPDFRGNDMGAGSYTHGARGYRGKRQNGILEIYGIKINFVTNVTHVTNQSGIVYHEAKGL